MIIKTDTNKQLKILAEFDYSRDINGNLSVYGTIVINIHFEYGCFQELATNNSSIVNFLNQFCFDNNVGILYINTIGMGANIYESMSHIEDKPYILQSYYPLRGTFPLKVRI